MGGNRSRSRHLPPLKPTNSVIPYQDFVQVACKNELYYLLFAYELHVVLVQLFAFLLLSSICFIYIRYCNQRRNKFFLPKRKIAGNGQCKLPQCTMVRKILLRQLRVRDYAHVYNIGWRHMPTQQDLRLLSFSQQLLGIDRLSYLNLSCLSRDSF